MTGTEPRFVGPSSLAAGLGVRWDELSALGDGRAPHFSRSFRTRIYRLGDESLSLTELDDDFHEMRIALRVGGDGTILEAVGRMNRHPYDTCPRAVESLEALTGMNVFAPRDGGRIRDRIPRSEGCLHLADMLAIAFRSFRIAKGHDISYEGEAGRRELLVLMPRMRDTCVSYAVEG
jgi:DUF2889 family protein